MNKTNVVVIGGGTGSYVVLRGLKKYSDKLDISSIVTVSDSGGSAKTERDEFGVLPSSDVRKALLALADEESYEIAHLRKMMKYRFADGGEGLAGGTLGNLMIVALTKSIGSQAEAIRVIGKMLGIKGYVYPVSLKTSNLGLKYADGTFVVGEHYLDDFPADGRQMVVKADLRPKVEVNPEIYRVIDEAEYIVIPPGDLYGSIIVNFLVSGMSDIVSSFRGKIIQIVNMMTKYGQTYDLPVSGHVKAVEDYIRQPIDYILIDNAEHSEELLDRYEEEYDAPVRDDLFDDPRVIRANLSSEDVVRPEKGDQIKRSLIRHDSDKLARELTRIILGD